MGRGMQENLEAEMPAWQGIPDGFDTCIFDSVDLLAFITANSADLNKENRNA